MIEINNKKKCLTCKGSGTILISFFKNKQYEIVCPYCGGTGYTKPLINLKEEEK